MYQSASRRRPRVRASILVALALAAAPTGKATARSPSDLNEPEEARPPLDEYTAFAVRGGQLKLGILAFEYGLTDWLSVGSDPPLWVLGAFLPVFAPNLHLEATLWRRPDLRVSLQTGGYYVRLEDKEDLSVNLWSVPVSLFTSLRLVRPLWLHLEGAYVFTDASGSGDLRELEDAQGGLTGQAVQVGAMLEWRLLPWLALTLRGRGQLWTSSLRVQGEGQWDPYTRAQLDGELEPRTAHPFLAVAGVVLRFPHLALRLGGGYGNFFVPGVSLALPQRRFVPDGSLAFYF